MNNGDTPTVQQLQEALGGISTEELARRLGVCRGTVQRWSTRGAPKQGPGRATMKLLWHTIKQEQEQARGVNPFRP